MGMTKRGSECKSGGISHHQLRVIRSLDPSLCYHLLLD